MLPKHHRPPGRQTDGEPHRLLPTPGRIAEVPEKQREVDAVGGHGIQEILCKVNVVMLLGEETELASKPGVEGCLELRRECCRAPPQLS